MPLTVLVTDGDQRPALAIVRALGRRGLTVVVGEERPVSLASASRHCAGHVTYPSPYRDRDGFDRFLVDVVSREHVDVVLPVTDVTTRAICAQAERLRRDCALAVPPFDAFELVTDKARLIAHATRCGVPVPRTQLVSHRDRLDEALAGLNGVAFPVVVKPARSRIPTTQGWIAGTAHYAPSSGHVRRLFDEHEYLARHPALIQERVVGAAIGMFAAFDHGELVAEFAHRRLREKPPSGGASVLSESIPVDPRLRDFAIRLLTPIGWHGVVMMEYKQDRRTGDFALIEVNGRFWGSLQLAIDAGVDFPFLAVQLACGRAPEPPRPYAIGAKNRWLLGDLDHLLLRLLRSDRSLNLPPGTPSIGRTVLEFLKFAEPGLRYDVIRSSDWRPFAYEAREYLRGLRSSVSRAARRVWPARTAGVRTKVESTQSVAIER